MKSTMDSKEQQFLQSLEKKLWTSADKLRSNLDAAVYKHVILGLIFIKYISDAFAERRDELEAAFRNPDHDYFFGDDADEESINKELEVRDFYTEQNVFWVPEKARWKTLQDCAKLSVGARLPWGDEFKSVGKMLDDALEAIEKENPKLKGVLNKDYARLQLESGKLGELIDLIATVPFHHDTMKAKDILGHVYEYFLGQFASAEGKKGGQFYTPKSIVSLIVEMLEPYQGRVYDPCCGSGGFFVQSERFIEEHGGRIGQISIFGQESNPTTWRLSAMNLAIRGLDYNLGKEPANTFTHDLHPDLRADTIMANPPFNMKEWWDGKLEGDARWVHGTPPRGNANFAWVQHMLYHLAPNGSMGLLLANGSMSSNSSGEGDIRKNLVKSDLVECMVALPSQLFTNTQIPACIWFLTKNKSARDKFRDRKGEVLFIDARQCGYMADRVLRVFDHEKDIKRIANTFHAWRRGDDYEDVPGFCKSATVDEIGEHGFVLTPGRYVGAAAVEDDGVPFTERFAELNAKLEGQFAEADELTAAIREKTEGVVFDG